MTKDTKFKRGDWVRVVRGFERGFVGPLCSHFSAGSRDRYGLIINHGLEFFSEDEIKLTGKPWWVLW